jgi:molecular chaperone HtpG
MPEKFERVQFSTDDIGVLLLESITKGLYTDARHCIREYLQNEFDAGAATVHVSLDGRTVSILGDSQGMTKEGLLRARRVGFSGKDPAKEAGFRGIGIWSGVAVCQTLNVISKARGSSEGHYLRIDARGLRDAIRRRGDQPLIPVLSENVEIRTIRSDEMQEKYGTRVELVDVLREHDRILSEPDLIDYLSQTAPVAIAPFQAIGKSVEEKLSTNIPNYRVLSLRVNQEQVFRPPSKDTKLQPPVFDWIRTGEGADLAYLWYAMNERPTTLPPEDRGLVYKSKGFTIGDQERTTVRKLEPGSALQQNVGWVVGEIHLVDPALLPNSERIDIETNSSSEYFRNRVRELLRRIDKEVRQFSEKRSADSHVVEAERLLAEISSAPDVQSKVEMLAPLQRTGEFLAQDLKSPKTGGEVKARIERSLQQVEQTKREVFRELAIPEARAPETSAKRRKLLAKQSADSDAVDREIPQIIKAFQFGPTEERLLKQVVDCMRSAGIPDSKILRFVIELQRKLSYDRVQRGQKR